MKKGIKTLTRRVQQTYRRFSNKKKREIVMEIINRPTGMSIDEACMICGINNGQFYVWKHKLGISSPKPSVPFHNGRVFTKEQKRDIIFQIDNRPPDVKKTDMFLKFGLGKTGSLYYTWKKELGMETIVPVTENSVRSMVSSKPLSSDVVRQHRITLNIEVSSLMELIGFCNEIGRLPKVKTILSVE